MGCGSSTGEEKKISMVKTALPEVDKVFDDAQLIIDDLYTLKEPIEAKQAELVEAAGFGDCCGATTQHAILGTIYAAFASCKDVTDILNMVKVTIEDPYVKFTMSPDMKDIEKNIKCLEEYIKVFSDCKEKIEPLVKKVEALAKQAPELPAKAKEAATNAKDMGFGDK